MNPIQPRPKDGADEATIQRNLDQMNYPAREDITRQEEEVDAPNLSDADKQATTASDVQDTTPQ